MAFLEILGTQLGKAFAAAVSPRLLDKIKRKGAARKAARGGAGAEGFSLEHLLRQELRELAKSSDLPAGLAHDGFRDWILRVDQEKRFATTLLRRAGGGADDERFSELATSYSQHTGQRSETAVGAINYVLDHLLTVIQSTDSGRQLLANAIQLRTAGQLELASKASRPEALTVIHDSVRSMAGKLFQAGARNWNMPARVVTLSLDHRFGAGLAGREHVEFNQASDLIGAHKKVVIFGDGGLGKTTLLLHVCSQFMKERSRVPLFLDAATWARSGRGMLEYLAGREQALASQVQMFHLAKLASQGQLALLVNGWNEIAGEHRERCRSELADLEATYEDLAFIVTTRAWQEFPAMTGTQYLQVLGLTWKEQVAAIRSALPPPAAAALRALLAKQSDLRYDTRSPLILKGVLDIAFTEDIASASTLDLIGAAVVSFERNALHASALSARPLDGRARAYLQAIAFELTRTVRIEFSRDDALRALNTVATKLLAEGLLLVPPHTPDILSALVAHHLLQEDEGVIRFAHQRFQEYFAALQVLDDCAPQNQAREALRVAIRGAGWEEVLRLVAQKLRHESLRSRRATLVSEALNVDLGLACDLAGDSNFGEADDVELYERCVDRVKELSSSSLDGVRALATCLQIASRWPVFADQLWPLLESNDQQVRLTSYRLSREGITLRQLGAGAAARISGWSRERQSEFVHEVAENSENVPYLEEVARSSPIVELRKAAISSLLWNYPASEVGLQLWAQAPDSVRVELLGYVSEILERVPEPDFVQHALGQMADTLDHKQQVQFAREFPLRATGKAVPGLLAHLRAADDRSYDDAKLLSTAMRLAPTQVWELATDLATSRPRLPVWVWGALKGRAVEVVEEQRRALVARLTGENWAETDALFTGAILSVECTTMVLDTWLSAETEARTSSERKKYEKPRHLQDALLAASGAVLAGAVAMKARSATYAQAVELIELLLRRVQREPSPMQPNVESWFPTVSELRLLLGAVENVAKPEDGQNALRAYFASLCSKSHALEFEPFIFDVFEHHLELWSAYARAMADWNHRLPRPTNPYLGQYIGNAAAALGFAAIPRLLTLASHPQAKNLVPDTLVQIVNAPWRKDAEQSFSNSVGAALIEGRKRNQLGRKSLQPTDDSQAATDLVGEYFIRELKACLSQTDSSLDSKTAGYEVCKWAIQSSQVPSPLVVPAVLDALGSGLADRYATVEIARGLLRAGVDIGVPVAVHHIEQLLELDSVQSVGDSERYVVGELAALLVCKVPDELISKPWTHWLDIWLKFSGETAVIEVCRSGGCLRAWDILESRLAGNSGDACAMHVDAIHKIVDAQSLPRLLAHVRSGALFACTDSTWPLEQQTSRVASLLRGNAAGIAAFIEACGASPAPIADAYLFQVLGGLGYDREALGKCMLDSLDAGRISNMRSPGMYAMHGIFAKRQELSESTYEVLPAACNVLRLGLYERAKLSGCTSELARRFLADLEGSRRESGRPDDEPRHPDASDGMEWTRALVSGG